MAQSPEPPPHPRKFNTPDSERFNKKTSICHCSVLARGVAGAAFEEADEMLGVLEAEAVADLRDRERQVVEQLARRMASPDINTEDFSAAVDFLSVQPDVDANRIGILGICGFGGFAISAAANDTRIKATVASTMYDMCRVTANGYNDSDDNADARYKAKEAINAQRTEDYRTGAYRRAGGVVDPLPDDAPQFVKEYYAYYKTPRGYHVRSGNSTDGWNVTSSLPFINFTLLDRAGEIRNAVMVVHGEKAHSRYFSEDAFKKLHGDNKELLIVADANHCDLYDNLEKIPFDQIATFFSTYMK